MKKAFLTLALLSGVYSVNISAIYAGDHDEVAARHVNSVIRNNNYSQKASLEKREVIKHATTKKVMTKEEGIETLTYYSSVAVAGIATVGYMIAQPSHAFAVLVPWVAYSIPKMVISAVEMCKNVYNDHLEDAKKPALEAVVKAGVPARYQKNIADNLMGRSQSYINKFVEFFCSVKREGLTDYQSFSMAFAISTLREDKIGLVSEVLKCFEDNGDVYSWYNIVEDSANSIRHGSPKGVCVENESAVDLIKTWAARKTN